MIGEFGEVLGSPYLNPPEFLEFLRSPEGIWSKSHKDSMRILGESLRNSSHIHKNPLECWGLSMPIRNRNESLDDPLGAFVKSVANPSEVLEESSASPKES